jgi:hypothetical protein
MGKNSGTLYDYDYSRTYYPECYDGEMNLTAATAVTAEGSSSEDWNQIEEGEDNIWRFHFHFNDRPKEFLGPCQQSQYSSYWAEPDSYQLIAEIGGAEDENEITFLAPSPNESTNDDDENEQYGPALDILDGVGGIYTSLGAAIGRYYLNSGSSAVRLQRENFYTKYTWNLDLAGAYEDLPKSDNGEAKSVQVGMKVHSDYSSGSHSIKYTPEYTFSYNKLAKSPEGYCGCKEGALYGNIYRALKTTSPTYPGYATYEAIQ